MGSLVFWATAALVVPGLVYALELKVLHWLSRDEPPAFLQRLLPESLWRRRTRPPAEPLPPVLLALELQRISERLRAVEASDVPHKAERLASWQGAYDLVLVDYSRTVDPGLEVPAAPLTAQERSDLETMLVGSGHGW